MTNPVNLTDNGLFPSGGAMFAEGFGADTEPMRSILLLQPNANDGAVPLDRSRSGQDAKAITAVNGASLSAAQARYGQTSLKLLRASKQHARITPFAEFAFGTKVFGLGMDVFPTTDAARQVLFSSGTSPGCYQIARTAANTLEVRIKGGVLSGPTPAAWPILPSGITTTRYVDAVNGNDANNGTTPALAWKTLSKAASTATAGTAVEFANGSYDGSVLQTTNGTVSNPIVFYAKTRHGAKIVHPAGSTRDQGFETRGDYVHTLGFECDGSTYTTGTRWRFGLSCAGTNSHVDYNKVHDISMNTSAPAGGGAGILLEYFYNKLGQVANANEIYRIGPLGGTSSTLHAIYWTGEATMTNNLIYQCVGVGLHGYHSPRNSIVANNIVDGAKYGVYFGYAGLGSSYNSWPGPTTNVRCRNNIILNTTNQAFFEEGASVTSSTYANNTIFNCASQYSLTSGATPANTLTTDPQFVDVAARNYRLAATSPARNAGSATEAPAADLLGYSRPLESVVDRGAYEYVTGTSASADTVYTTTQAVPGNAHTHVWVARDAGNTLTIRLEGKTVLTQAGVTTDLKADFALIGTADGTNDCLDGYVDGFHAAVGTTVYTADFGPGVGAPPPQTTQPTLLFEETFATFDPRSTTDKWNTRLAWGNGSDPANSSEYAQYVNVEAGDTRGPNPFSVVGGNLRITGTPTAGLTNGKTYTSGVIQTRGKFSCTYGYFEIRCKMPGGLGFWPAFWLMAEDLATLPELDVMEFASKFPNEYPINAHWNDGSGQTSIGDEQGYVGNFIKNLPDLRAGFHTYGLEWTPSFLTYYFDGQQIFQRATPANAGFDEPHYIIVNMAVGGTAGWVGPPDGSTQTFEVDYVRVWDRKGTGSAYYVATNGNDSWTGLLAEPNVGNTDGPFLTLGKARDAMRASGLKRTIVRGGTYRFTTQMTLNTADNGTTWEAYPGETPILSGGEKLTGFASEGAGLYALATTQTSLDLFVGDVRQKPAQSGVYNPADPYKSGWLVAPADGTTTTVRFIGGQVATTELDTGVLIQTFDRDRLADAITGVTSIDTATTTITLASAVQYAVRAGGTFRFLNRAANIRNTGEFGWRASDGKLVMKPAAPGSFEATGVYAPRIGRLMTLAGTQSVTFKGLTFKHGKYTDQFIRLEGGATGNTFDGCNWLGVGTALQISASNNNRVINCSFKSIGWWGIYLDAQASDNLIEANTFTDMGEVRKDTAAVGANGVHRNVIRYNDIDGSARYGVSIKDWNANNAHTGNVVEFNVIKNCCRETADGAGVESLGRSNGDTQLSVKGNWIEGVVGLATNSSGGWLTPYKGWGVFLDDQTNGATVRENFIKGTSWASVFIHGGDNNLVENNVMVIATEQEAAIRIEHSPLAGTIGVPDNNTVRKNVVYATTAVTDYWALITPGVFTLATNCVYRSAVYTGAGDVAADPQFTDSANGNWRLKIGSPAFQVGFTDLKYELMGVDGIAMGPAGTVGGGGSTPPSSSYPATKGGFLVSGNQILDGAMKPVRFTGANLNGAEWNDAANTFGLLPGGYTARNYKAILDDIKALGFNLVRLPFADSTVVSTRTRHGFAEGPNPEFIGLKPIDILGLTCRYARQIGLYILLDHHRNNASSGAGTQVNFLAGDGFTLQNIIDNWKTLVTHPDILGNPAVMGCDIHNEPNGRAFNWSLWAPQAEQIANAIHSVNPNVLAVIEGNEISFSQGGEAWGWWGGNLHDFDTRPIALSRMDKLVLSTHEYGPYLVGPKPWHNAASFPANMFGPANWGAQTGIWDFFWGALWRAKRFPILVGELGAKFEDPVGQAKEFTWIAALHRYLNGELNGDGQMFLGAGEVGMSWTMWTMSPTSGDTGGIWGNDWKTVQTNRYDQYKTQLWKGVITPPPQISVAGTRL
ncbi:cellulase family glycosylhydrolase [Azospirillum sp. sgz301742]